MKLSELLYEGEYKSRYSPETIEIARIVSDTRALEPHCLFICLKGVSIKEHFNQDGGSELRKHSKA